MAPGPRRRGVATRLDLTADHDHGTGSVGPPAEYTHRTTAVGTAPLGAPDATGAGLEPGGGRVDAPAGGSVGVGFMPVGVAWESMRSPLTEPTDRENREQLPPGRAG